MTELVRGLVKRLLERDGWTIRRLADGASAYGVASSWDRLSKFVKGNSQGIDLALGLALLDICRKEMAGGDLALLIPPGAGHRSGADGTGPG